jgi:hypothetical protein
MRIHALLLLLAACSTAAADPSAKRRTDPATRIWMGDVRKLADHWVVPSLHERDGGAELIVSIAIPVARLDELAAVDVAADLLVSGGGLACTAEKQLGFTTLGSTNAQATITCRNSGRLVPTHLVVRVRGVKTRYSLGLTSLVKPA